MKITAKVVPYSSVLGSSITLHDETGVVIGQLSLMNVAAGRAAYEAMAVRIAAAINAGQPERRVHHPGRGATYDVVADAALFQVSRGDMGLDGPMRLITDGDPVTVYRNEHGTFVRFPDEMVSPHFEEV